MILHLTLGSTHIPIEINVEGSEPHLSVLDEGRVLAFPVSAPGRPRRFLPRKLTLAGVAILSGLAGYHFAPGGGTGFGALLARADVARHSTRAAPVEADQIPLPMRRELAGRPVVTPTAPAEVGAKPAGGNPFGLE